MVKVGTDLSGTMLRGVLPEEENKVSDIDAHIKDGSFDSLKAGTYNIVIGNELAESLGVTIGDKIDLMVPQASVTPAGLLRSFRRFTVSCIVRIEIGRATVRDRVCQYV